MGTELLGASIQKSLINLKVNQYSRCQQMDCYDRELWCNYDNLIFVETISLCCVTHRKHPKLAEWSARSKASRPRY